MAEQRFEQHVRDTEKSVLEAQIAATDMYKMGIDLFRKGMQRNIAIEMHALDLASEQNSENADLCKSMFRSIPGAEPMFNSAEQMVENLIGMGRRFLDTMGKQSDEMSESAKRQEERMSQASHELISKTA